MRRRRSLGGGSENQDLVSNAPRSKRNDMKTQIANEYFKVYVKMKIRNERESKQTAEHANAKTNERTKQLSKLISNKTPCAGYLLLLACQEFVDQSRFHCPSRVLWLGEPVGCAQGNQSERNTSRRLQTLGKNPSSSVRESSKTNTL